MVIDDETFEVGDTVRFRKAAHWNRDRDYRVAESGSDGVVVEVTGHAADRFTYWVDREACARLDMVKKEEKDN